jgi:polyhydroxyalkanoate synthase
LPSARLGSLRWHPSLKAEADALAAALARSEYGDLAANLGQLVGERTEAYLRGVRLYQVHPWRRPLGEPPVLWQSGSSRLLDYGPAGAPPVLCVPSLINRAYVMDLSERRSFARFLASKGLRCLLMDWGTPGPDESGFVLSDYVHRLLAAIDAVGVECGRPPVLLGYCMGGDLALAAAQRAGDRIAALALLATPWDFHAGMPAGARLFAAMRPAMEAAKAMPIDMLQLLFLSLDPALGLRKFSAFAGMDQDSDEARDFVVLEDWLNDGVPLIGGVARECLAGWYGDNDTVRLRWKVDGEPVLPAAIATPSLIVVPEADRIVPPESALALADMPSGMRNAEILRPPLGHIGMMSGRRAPDALWRALVNWILAHAPAKGLSRRRAPRYGAAKRKRNRPCKGVTP